MAMPDDFGGHISAEEEGQEETNWIGWTRGSVFHQDINQSPSNFCWCCKGFYPCL